MRRNHRQRAAVVAVLLLAAACASVGTGDPVIVRTEDVLSNSLQVYSQAMEYHFRNSTTETPAVYKAFENFRVKLPAAWNAVDQAKRTYQRDKATKPQLDSVLDALSTLISGITPLLQAALQGGH